MGAGTRVFCANCGTSWASRGVVSGNDALRGVVAIGRASERTAGGGGGRTANREHARLIGPGRAGGRAARGMAGSRDLGWRNSFRFAAGIGAHRAGPEVCAFLGGAVPQGVRTGGIRGADPRPGRAGAFMNHVALVLPGIERLAGAERQAILLAKGLARRGWRVSVIALTGEGGDAARDLEAARVSFVSLRMRKGVFDPRGWVRFHRWIKEHAPDVLHAHLPHGSWMARGVRI